MNSYDLVDVYRTLHKDTRKYSWRRFNSTQRSGLDYLLVCEVLGLDITSADITGYFSDHSLLCIGFKTGIVKRRRPLWKFNNSLLRDMTFVNLIKQVILDLKKQYAVPVYDRNNIHKIVEEDFFFFFFFLMILLKIIGSCIFYASFKKEGRDKVRK